jgi:retinol dehydrogenase-12
MYALHVCVHVIRTFWGGGRRSIKAFADAFLAKDLPLHVLVNNAGVFLVPHDFTQEGFETVVGTNYFGPFLLTHLLLGKLQESAPAR